MASEQPKDKNMKQDNTKTDNLDIDHSTGSEISHMRELLFYGDPLGVILMRADFRGITYNRAKYLLSLFVEFEWAYIRGNYYFFNNLRWLHDEDCSDWNNFLSQNVEYGHGVRRCPLRLDLHFIWGVVCGWIKPYNSLAFNFSLISSRSLRIASNCWS